MYHYVGLLLLEIIPLKEVEQMTLEARLISNSNAFFVASKQFQIALMQQKKSLPTGISND